VVTRTIRLRPWQKAALERFTATERADFLAVATPGAGKTTFALTAAVGVLGAADGPRRLVVVAPTAHLKRQWAEAAAGFGLHLDPAWSATDGHLPADMHGIVTTYQQVATSAEVLSRVSAGAMVVFDELHHAADDRAWGASIRQAFEPARRRLALSGTPFRSDTQAIPFLTYELDIARPDYEYGYGEALADGRVVRPIFFPRTNGHMEWSAPDGSQHSATFDDPLATARANQRLRTALSLEGDWLPSVLRAANDRLNEIRRSHPAAGGLVIATDQDHARGIAEVLEWRLGVRAEVATSDDGGASERISRFAGSERPWLVAVRMVSEGVDIPRLRVGVYATTTTTELFFRQAVGRFVRWTPGVPGQRAYLWIPDDVRLRARAFQIAEVRRHSLRRDTRPEGPDDLAAFDSATEVEAELVGPEREQLSLFGVISAVATDTEVHGSTLSPTSDPPPGPGDDADPDDEADTDDPDLTVDLSPLPALGPSGRADHPLRAPDGRVLTRREHKRRLRETNAELARALVHQTGWGHAKVNAELNRLAGIARITEATVEQLERRIRQGEHWYTRVTSGGSPRR
jgi:superfamily II DNA or RNA helicase